MPCDHYNEISSCHIETLVIFKRIFCKKTCKFNTCERTNLLQRCGLESFTVWALLGRKRKLESFSLKNSPSLL
jgi:hypothetical protein